MSRIASGLAALAVIGAASSGLAAPKPAANAPPTEIGRRETIPALPPEDTRPARQAANIDLTGYWVSVVSEDWRFRMVTPPKLDYSGVPINAAGRKVAGEWDIEKDRAAGLQCIAYGAPGLFRRPGRLHITWKDDNALRIEADAGSQVRDLPFGKLPVATPPIPDSERTWQGRSVAQWEKQAMQASGLQTLVIPPSPPSYSLKVVTTGLRPGYLRTNGVPFSATAVLTEYFDIFKQGGVDWLVVTSIVDDPVYLQQPFIVSSHFKREPDGSKWAPSPCTLEAPTRGPRPGYDQ